MLLKRTPARREEEPQTDSFLSGGADDELALSDSSLSSQGSSGFLNTLLFKQKICETNFSPRGPAVKTSVLVRFSLSLMSSEFRLGLEAQIQNLVLLDFNPEVDLLGYNIVQMSKLRGYDS